MNPAIDFLNNPAQLLVLRSGWRSLAPGLGLTTEEALEALAHEKALLVCLVSPGLFVVLVAFDTEHQEFLILDPWSGLWPAKSMWNQSLTIDEFLHHSTPKFLITNEAA